MQTEDDILATARLRMSEAVSFYSQTRASELDDLRFAHGSADNNWQWPTYALNTRGGDGVMEARPTLTVNKLPQHIKTITNNIRRNRPAGKVIPVGNDANLKVSEIYTDLLRYIGYKSNEEVAYDIACENQVTFGEGYFKIYTEYCDENSFDQDIRIGRIGDSFSVYMDPLAQDPSGQDAEWCLVTETMRRKEFEKLYPDSQIGSISTLGIGDNNLFKWFTEETVVVADYYFKERTRSKLNEYANGEVVKKGTPEDKDLAKFFGKPVRSRDVLSVKVKALKITGSTILEDTEWVGTHIPIVRVIGDSVTIDGIIYYSGIVRNAKDPQRMYNYWTSQQAEMLALAPKSPFIVYSGQINGYEDKWKTANLKAWPYLEVNASATDNAGKPLPLPQRVAPPMSQPGIIEARMGAAEDIKSATGQYNAALGATSNERTGKAIFARQEQSDMANYHYSDNLAKAIQYGAKQIIEIIPKVYDTGRILEIMGEGGDIQQIKVDPSQEEAVREFKNSAGEVERIYNLNVGKYDVRVVVGPGYQTRRQEALESMGNVLQANPQLWQVAGDLFVKNMDWPGAQEMAKRIEKSIDPKLIDASMDPKLQAAQMQMEQLVQQNQQLMMMLKNIEQSIEVREQDRQDFEATVKAYDAETKRLSLVQSTLSEEQIQDIAMGTVDAMMETQALLNAQGDSLEPEMPQDQLQGQSL